MEQQVKNSNQPESPSKSTGEIKDSPDKPVRLSMGEKIGLVVLAAMLLFILGKKISSSIIDLAMNKYPSLYTEECLNKHGYSKENNQKYIVLKK